jgi:hypothetical protein
MANNNKNINELVSDDGDPTVALETLVQQQSFTADDAISGHGSGPKSRSETYNRLQLDMEQFRAKWLGLATEIRTREQASKFLNNELEDLQDSLRRTIDLLKKRDQKIRTLESEIQEFNTEKRIATLTSAVAAAEKNCANIGEELELLHKSHADEIRLIRMDLGEAQETISQNDLISEQLSSDLVETQVYRAELERMLNKSERTSQSRIEHLEEKNRKLQRESGELNDKLGANNQSINCLLAELAQNSQQVHSIEVIEDVVHEHGDHKSGNIDAHVPAEQERIARMLIGSVKGRELRFPLFKNRLTIGRSRQNDVQLKGPSISRRHAVVVTDGESTRVIDWGSKNGVAVNSKPITEHFLENGDIVTVGTAKFRYEERRKRGI